MALPAQAPPLEAPDQRRPLAWALITGALAVFALALAGLITGTEPFASWFFVFAWWSWIFALDGIVFLRRERSILFDRARGFWLLVPWSTAFWLVFEVVNLRLENWYYAGLPASTLSRYLGIFVSFATVLLGIFETEQLLRSFGLFRKLRCRPGPWRVTDSRRRLLLGIGAAMAILPLVFPRYFFPLVWGASFFLLEPWLAKRNQPSVWGQLAAGRPGGPLRILLAGAICGLCWESWNFWASSKWIYTVPFFEELKLFEMPLLGFLGFPPFALECYTFSRVLVARGLVPEWEPGRSRRVVSSTRQHRWALGAALVSLPLIWVVDRSLVRSTAPTLEDFASLGAEQREALRARELRDGSGLARALEDGVLDEELDAATRQAARREWALFTTALMGRRGAEWLRSVDVLSVEELSAQESEDLLARLRSDGQGPAPTPSGPEVRVWCRKARARVAAD